MSWDEMHRRLHAVDGYGGDLNKGRRKAWLAAALGYRPEAPPANLFLAYHRAGVEQQRHVARSLEELEQSTKGEAA